MAFATHLIKIKGHFDTEKWTEEKTREHIGKKIREEIDSLFHADLELLRIKDGAVEVWVYVSAFSSEVTENIIKKWLNDHIKEDGIALKDFEIVKVANFLDPIDENKKQKFLVYIALKEYLLLFLFAFGGLLKKYYGDSLLGHPMFKYK